MQLFKWWKYIMQLQLALSLILQILFSPKSPHLVFYGGDEENYLPVQILS